MGLPLFFQKLLQDEFGIDPNEFIAKNAMEKIDVAGMDAEAVVDHREMTDAVGVEPVDRQHHVCGVHGMDEVSDDVPSTCFRQSIFLFSSSSYMDRVISILPPAGQLGFFTAGIGIFSDWKHGLCTQEFGIALEIAERRKR